jgi:hypothetical protein
VAAAQDSLAGAVAAALEFDAKRFRDHLATDTELLANLGLTIDVIAALLRGDDSQLQAVPVAGEQSTEASGDIESEKVAEPAGNDKQLESPDA